MKQKRVVPLLRGTLYVVVVAYLTACAAIPEDLGRAEVEGLIRSTTGVEPNQTPPVSGEITLSAAVETALANNPEFRLQMAALGYGAADVYAASRIRNPVFSASIFDSTEAGAKEQVTIGLVASFTDMITLPQRKRYAAAEYAQLKQQVAHAAAQTVKSTQMAFVAHAAAQERMELAAFGAHSADVSLRLAERFVEAGNMSPHKFALAQTHASELLLAELEAQAAVAQSRAHLADILGLDAADTWEIAGGIPEPSANEIALDEALKLSFNNRLDLKAAVAHAKSSAQREGLEDWVRWIDEFEVGYERERETDGSRLRGPHVDWALPLISQNRDRLLRAQVKTQQSLIEIEQLQNQIKNQVWLAHRALANARQKLQLLTNQLMPAQQQATERAQEEQAYMLIGVFELLESKQAEFGGLALYIEALENYWSAAAQLSYAMGSPMTDFNSQAAFRVSSVVEPDEPENTNHNHHQHHQHQGHKMKEGHH